MNSLDFLFKTDKNGVIEQVVLLPDAVNAAQVRFGYEGVAEYNGSVYVAFQRTWTGDTANEVRIGIYDITNKTWDFAFYTLDDPSSLNGGWVGLSDLTSLGDGTLAAKTTAAKPSCSTWGTFSKDDASAFARTPRPTPRHRWSGAALGSSD